MVFCDHFLPLSRMFSRFISIYRMYQNFIPLRGLIIACCMDIPHLIYPFTSLGISPVGWAHIHPNHYVYHSLVWVFSASSTLLTNDVRNICASFFVDMFLFLLDRYLAMQCLGHIVIV